MRENLKAFLASEDISVLEALGKIDRNKCGFLIVVDKDMQALGTLTDGDIRRALIRGKPVAGRISDIYIKNFKSIDISGGLSQAIEIFKNDTISFLPILSGKGELINILQKRQMHTLFLQDIDADLTYDFMELDMKAIDYEIFPKPWGLYKTTIMNNYFQSKVLYVNPFGKLSLQHHNHREEHWIVAHGTGIVQLDQTIMAVHCGSTVFIPKGCKHRLSNTDAKETLIVIEVQIGDYFGEDDIVRHEDAYGRT